MRVEGRKRRERERERRVGKERGRGGMVGRKR